MASINLNEKEDGVHDWDAKRKRVLDRDDHKCRFCGDDESNLNAHHIIPKSDGGSDKISNLVTVCPSCHGTLEWVHGKAMGRIAESSIDDSYIEGFEDNINSKIESFNDEMQCFLNSHPLFQRCIDAVTYGVEVEVHEVGPWLTPDGEPDISSEYEFIAAYGYVAGLREAIDRFGNGVFE